MNSKLNPCPFCNSMELSPDNNRSSKDPMYWVRCTLCGATGPKNKTIENCINSWNGGLLELSPREFDSAIKEMMGAGATPGMGNAVPAPMAAATGAQQTSHDCIGSGDNWSHTIQKSAQTAWPQQKPQKKDKKKKHKIQPLNDYLKNRKVKK
jgi:hypothetical protein